MSKRTSTLVFLLTFIYVGALPVAYALRAGVVAPIFLFAGDAFYYLDVARNSRGVRGFSFDGSLLTNGFHPLWEYMLVGLRRAGIVDFSHGAAALLPVYYLDVLLLALGAAFFAVFASRILRRPLLALLLFAPGLFWIGTGALSQSYLSTWSYVNGMESAAALFCFSVGLFLWRNEPLGPARSVAIAFFLGLGILARLDDVFLAVAVAGLLWVRAGDRRKRLAELSPVAILLGVYLIYNLVSIGVMLPMSGVAKAGFGLVHNAESLVRMFLPVVTGGSAKTLLAPSYGYSAFSEGAARMVQMLLPAVVCGVEVWLLVRRRGGWQKAGIVHALALGVIAKAAYNCLFVQLWNQGMWYYTVSIAVANLVLVIWLDGALGRWQMEPGTRRVRRRVLLAAHGLGVLLAFNIFISARNFAGSRQEVKLLLNKGPVEAELARLGAKRIIEFDDGFTSYVANVPAAAALGLALDREAAQALREGDFLPLLQRRGYRIAVAHGDYATAMDATLAQAAAGGRTALWAIRGSEFDRYTFRPLGGDGSDDRLSYYELVPIAIDKPSAR